MLEASWDRPRASGDFVVAVAEQVGLLLKMQIVGCCCPHPLDGLAVAFYSAQTSVGCCCNAFSVAEHRKTFTAAKQALLTAVNAPTDGGGPNLCAMGSISQRSG